MSLILSIAKEKQTIAEVYSFCKPIRSIIELNYINIQL